MTQEENQEEISAEEKLRRCHLILMSARNAIKFFGVLFTQFDLQVLKSGNNGSDAAFTTIIGIKPKIFIGEDFANNKSIKELLYVIIHEMMHHLDGHIKFYQNSEYDRELLNIAHDHIINTRIDKDIEDKLFGNSIVSPEDRIIINSLKDQNLTSGEVYQYLQENAEITKIPIQAAGQGSSSQGNSSNQDGDQENQESENQEGEGESGKNNGDQNQNNSPNNIPAELIQISVDGQVLTHRVDVLEPKNSSKGEIDESQNVIQGTAKSTMDSGIMNQTRGFSPGGLMEHIKELIKVELPWDEILQHSIKQSVKTNNSSKSWRSFNKRLRPHGIKLPGPGKQKDPDSIVIAIDTSGSVDNRSLRKFLSVIFDSVHYFKKGHIIYHDMTITSIKTIERSKSPDFEELVKIKGRGGTSHEEVYKKIQEMNDNQEKISMVIFQTDGYSDIDELHSRYEWTKNIPTKIVLNHSEFDIIKEESLKDSIIQIKEETN